MLTYAEAGIRLGVVKSVVHFYIKRGYIKRKKTGIPASEVTKFIKNPPTKKPTTQELKDLIKERYNAGGITMRKLGDEYGMSESLVSKIIKGTR